MRRSYEHGSVHNKMTVMTSHDNTLPKEENSKAYHLIGEAALGTLNSAQLNPFQRSNNNRRAWFTLIGQCAVKDKCEAVQKKTCVSFAHHDGRTSSILPQLDAQLNIVILACQQSSAQIIWRIIFLLITLKLIMCQLVSTSSVTKLSV